MFACGPGDLGSISGRVIPNNLKMVLDISLLNTQQYKVKLIDGNEGVLRIPQISCITGTSLSNCLVLYAGYSLVGVLPLRREAVGVFYSPRQVYIYTYIYIYIYIYIYVCVCVCVCVCVDIKIYIHGRTHTITHIYIYTYMVIHRQTVS